MKNYSQRVATAESNSSAVIASLPSFAAAGLMSNLLRHSSNGHPGSFIGLRILMKVPGAAGSYLILHQLAYLPWLRQKMGNKTPASAFGHWCCTGVVVLVAERVPVAGNWQKHSAITNAACALPADCLKNFASYATLTTINFSFI
jgi:hypothetical protein